MRRMSCAHPCMRELCETILGPRRYMPHVWIMTRAFSHSGPHMHCVPCMWVHPKPCGGSCVRILGHALRAYMLQAMHASRPRACRLLLLGLTWIEFKVPKSNKIESSSGSLSSQLAILLPEPEISPLSNTPIIFLPLWLDSPPIRA